MATTAKGTPYVESSDLVADYPSVSLALAEHIDDFGGKVLQIVRATDATNRTTTSTSAVDASISVTITPQKSDSAIIIIWAAYHAPTGGSSNATALLITDSSNNGISGVTDAVVGHAASTNIFDYATVIAYDTPATTAATTYKGRFYTITSGSTSRILNGTSTGQMYAIEVSA